MEGTPQAGVENEIIIEEPDITDPNALNLWLDKYVQKPFPSLEDTLRLSPAERIKASQDQLRTLVLDFTKMKRSPEQIKALLMLHAKGLQKKDDSPL